MRDYAELVKALRCCSKIDARNNGCDSCPYEYCGEDCQNLCGYAADAIEELLAEVEHWKLEAAANETDRKYLIDENKKLVNSLMNFRVPTWISAEERLPEDQGDDARAARGGDYIHKVLAASVTPNYTVMDTAYLENGIWSLSKYTSWKQIIGAPVTHWMPLPEPPKEVE